MQAVALMHMREQSPYKRGCWFSKAFFLIAGSGSLVTAIIETHSIA